MGNKCMHDNVWHFVWHFSVNTQRVQFSHARACEVLKSKAAARAAGEDTKGAGSCQHLPISEGGRQQCVLCKGCCWVWCQQEHCPSPHQVLLVGLLLSKFNTSKQKLTPAEEEVLVMSILEASQYSFPPTYYQIAMEAAYCYVFSSFFPFLRLSPKRPFTCPHELILSW